MPMVWGCIVSIYHPLQAAQVVKLTSKSGQNNRNDLNFKSLAYSQEKKIKLSRQIVNLFQYKLHDVTNVIIMLAQT